MAYMEYIFKQADIQLSIENLLGDDESGVYRTAIYAEWIHRVYRKFINTNELYDIFKESELERGEVFPDERS